METGSRAPPRDRHDAGQVAAPCAGQPSRANKFLPRPPPTPHRPTFATQDDGQWVQFDDEQMILRKASCRPERHEAAETRDCTILHFPACLAPISGPSDLAPAWRSSTRRPERLARASRLAIGVLALQCSQPAHAWSERAAPPPFLPCALPAVLCCRRRRCRHWRAAATGTWPTSYSTRASACPRTPEQGGRRSVPRTRLACTACTAAGLAGSGSYMQRGRGWDSTHLLRVFGLLGATTAKLGRACCAAPKLVPACRDWLLATRYVSQERATGQPGFCWSREPAEEGA